MNYELIPADAVRHFLQMFTRKNHSDFTWSRDEDASEEFMSVTLKHGSLSLLYGTDDQSLYYSIDFGEWQTVSAEEAFKVMNQYEAK